MFQDKNVQKYPNRSQRRSANKCPNRNAIMFPNRAVNGYQSRNVGRFPVKTVSRFQNRNARMFHDRNAEMYPSNRATKSQKKHVILSTSAPFVHSRHMVRSLCFLLLNVSTIRELIWHRLHYTPTQSSKTL